MPARLKAVLQYLVVLGITIVLVVFSLRGITVKEGDSTFDFLLFTWQSANKIWLLVMAAIAMISHVIRAERWRMLMAPAGHQSNLRDSFLSLMVGYLINLVVPRGGELSRCYNLYKLDKTPVELSFGTVIVERLVDVICLAAIIAFAFVLESDRLFDFIETLPVSNDSGSRVGTILIALLALVAAFFLARWLVRRNKKLHGYLSKKWAGFREGLLTVFKLKNKGLFISYSVLIWVLYFLMSYAVIQAFPETNHLGFSAVLSLFALGSIAMAAPLPGGAGSYHFLVPKGLVFLYGIAESDAVAFTFIFHGWQTALMILAGAISLVITSWQVRRNKVLEKT